MTESARMSAMEREMKPEGLSIAVKICLAVSVLLLMTTLVVGFFVARFTEQKITEEIKKKGVGCVNTLAIAGKILLVTKEMELQKKETNDPENGIAQPELGKGLIDSLKEQKIVFTGVDSQANAILADKDILDIKVLDSMQKPLITASEGMKLLRERQEINLYTIDPTVQTGPCVAEMEDGRIIHSYEFTKKITKGNRFLGTAIVLVSSEKIRKSRREVLTYTIGISAGAVVAGIIIAILIATNITRPIKVLVRDMKIVSKGDLKHRTRALSSKDEVGLLAQSFNKMTMDLERAHQAEVQQQRMNADLKAARDIQERLLPKKKFKLPTYDMKEFYRPSRDVGGDYYDTIVVDKEHLGLLVADVSGKGVQGGLVMTMMRTIVNIFALKNRSTAEVMKTTNQILAKELRPGMFVTAFYALLHVRSGKMRLSSAGHNDLIIYRKSKQDIVLVNPKGIALGLDKGKIFNRTVREEDIQLYNGDRVLLYTDGVVEAMNAKKEEFGDQRLYNFVRQHAEKTSQEFVDLLVETLDKHKGKAEQHDDITIFTFRVGG